MLTDYKLFDSHLHIIDKSYPLIANQGFLPDFFSCADYLARTDRYQLCGGVVVSGSFQAFDQSYLVAALDLLGEGFVGVTQLPHSVSDAEIIALHQRGIRGLRFNLQRGGSETIEHLSTLARRVYDLVGWHVELYVDASELADLTDLILTLPAVSIDHLGLKQSGRQALLRLAEAGVRVKACGFGRLDFDPKSALIDLYRANPQCLMFGTDLPSTRAPRPYLDDDFTLLLEIFDRQAANAILYQNACDFYRVTA